jgi:hypothetical protein
MDLCERCQGLICDECRRRSSTHSMPPPRDVSLPFFAYGALKPGMPAYRLLSEDVGPPPEFSRVSGYLLVRDGLPLLNLAPDHHVNGFLLKWLPGKESEAYSRICSFEPRSHYEWSVAETFSGVVCNVLVIRRKAKGNPQYLENPLGGMATSWRLTDDPAFGFGLEAVQRTCDAVSEAYKNSDSHQEWSLFFQSQMAYLLLWSILERLSALCVGPSVDPSQRIQHFSTIEGMGDAVRRNVHRTGKVFDSRDPNDSKTLDPNNSRKCFEYYYRVRSNLSHRGKAAWRDFEVVHRSLSELLSITRDYLSYIHESESSVLSGDDHA